MLFKTRAVVILSVLTSLWWPVVAGPGRSMETEDLFRIQRVSDPQASPDGEWVAYVLTDVDKQENKTNSDIWLVPAKGGDPKKLTQSPKQDRHPRWSPDGRWIAFESNRGGSFQIYLIAAAGGEAKPLTSISTEAAQALWSPDGKYIAFVSVVFPEFSEKPFKESDELNKKKLDDLENSKVKGRVITQLLYRHWDSWVDGKRQHLFVVPIEGGEPRDVTPGDRDAIPTSSTFSAGDDFDFSPDGTSLVYTATPSPTREEAWRTNHDLYSVELRSGERRLLTPNPAADAYPRHSPDGKYLAYRAQERAGFEADRWQLMLLDRASGKARSLTGNLDASVEAFEWAPDSKKIVFEAEEGGQKPLWIVSVGGGDFKKIVKKGVCGEISVAKDGKRLFFSAHQMTRPAEIFSAKLSGGDIEPVTRHNEPFMRGLEMTPAESVSYVGAGGTAVQMWIVKPPGFEAKKKYPLVFWVHGGPQGAFLDSWSYRWNVQLWAAQGYVIVMPNPRGSTGFGQKFTDEVSRDWGGKVFEDLLKGIDYVEKLPYVDTAKMAAAGASFGGYMMNWFQGHTDKFKTLVTHCGVYNFFNMYGATEEVWFDEWDHGLPWENPEFDKFSPHRFAKHFKTPNLIIHNELDFRVPINEGLSLFTTLQRKGIPSKLLYFPDEGHWVLKPQNSELWHRTVFDWLKDYLRP